jgi:hypothetical protein
MNIEYWSRSQRDERYCLVLKSKSIVSKSDQDSFSRFPRNRESQLKMSFNVYGLLCSQGMMDINYMGAVHAIRSVLPSMKSRMSGKITVVSSIAGKWEWLNDLAILLGYSTTHALMSIYTVFACLKIFYKGVLAMESDGTTQMFDASR